MTVGLTRRRIVQWLLGIAGGGLAIIGCDEDTAGPGSSSNPTPGSNLHLAVREHFDYLSIDDAVIDAFVRDLERHQGPWSPKSSPRPYTRFLASTDFFQNGADESRPLRYVAYYDPYVSTCYNPFAKTN